MPRYSETQMRHAMRPGEIVIEIDNEHIDVKARIEATDLSDLMNPDKLRIMNTETTHGNRQQQFPPVDMRTTWGRSVNFIRTRKVFKRDGNDARRGMHDALWNIDFLPGERIHIDFENKKGRITDAIFDPENDEIYQNLRRIAAEVHGSNKPFIPGEDVEKDLSDPYALWGWAYHMRRIMDGDTEHNAGPERHRGCCTDGPRLCRPVQNVDRMPTLQEIIASCKVLVPYTPFQKTEKEKEWIELRKSEDPNYVRQDGDKIVLTPWLAGFGPSKSDLAATGAI